MKTEYQGRGTPHWHIAAWVVPVGILRLLAGRIGTAVVSAFVKFIAALFHCQVDVQIGNGRFNYINGCLQAMGRDRVSIKENCVVKSKSKIPLFFINPYLM